MYSFECQVPQLSDEPDPAQSGSRLSDDLACACESLYVAKARRVGGGNKQLGHDCAQRRMSVLYLSSAGLSKVSLQFTTPDDKNEW